MEYFQFEKIMKDINNLIINLNMKIILKLLK